MKRYTIFIIPKIAAEYITVNGPTGPVRRKNISVNPVYPATFVRCIYEDKSDLYGDDPTKRTQLWEDSAGEATDVEIFAACPRLRDWQAWQIRMEGAHRMELLALPYQSQERDTWGTQVKRAEAFLANPQARTPILDGMAMGRGVEKAQLVEWIMGNSEYFEEKVGVILGQQQALLDKIYSEQSVEKLLAIRWPE